MVKYTSPFIPPKAIEIVYRNELYKLIKSMIKDYKSVLEIYKKKQGQLSMDADTWVTTDIENKMKGLGKKWGEKFAEYANSHSKSYVNRLLKMSNTQLKSVLKGWLADEQLTLIGQVIPVPVRQVVKASVEYNVSLVKSIASKYHDRVFGALMRSITGGGSLKELQQELLKSGARSLRDAKLISYDQTRKVYSSITLHSCQHYGIKKMMWRHSHADKHPRNFHITKWDGISSPQDPNGLDGLIFDLNNPPLIQRQSTTKTGKVIPARYGFPTDLINCTCYMRAVLE